MIPNCNLSSEDAVDRTRSVQPPHDTPEPGFCWVPIRSLSDRHRPRILAHLLALSERDRYLRFGYVASDVQLAHYAGTLNFSDDAVHGVFNRRLELVAMAHLAMLPAPTLGARRDAEFGVSVLPRARGRGYGRRLFDHAVLHARNRRVDTLVIHTLSDNSAMLHIVRNAGASVVREGGESLARLRLPPRDLFSHLDALLAGHAAELDYRLKRHSRHPVSQLPGVDVATRDIESAAGTGGE